MRVKRTGRFKVKASHPDYELIKIHTIEAKGSHQRFIELYAVFQELRDTPSTQKWYRI